MRKVIIATVVIFVFTVCQMLCASSILPVTPTPTITPTLYEKENPDGKTTIQLNSPGLTATQPRNIMAEDDDYTIEGTATGVDDVDIVLISPGETDIWGWANYNVLNGLEIDVGEIEVTIDVDRTRIIGEDMTLIVTASAGDVVDIVIDDILEFNDEVLVDGEAEVEWDTVGKLPGSYTIEVFVNCDDLTADRVGTDVEDEIDELDLYADGSTTIRLIEPGLTAKQLRNVVAEDDDYAIEGIATGVDDVDIVLIGPGYYGSDGKLGVEYGLDILSSSVIEAEFSEDITMEEGLDTGMWIAAVLSPGRDGEYSTGDEAGGLGLGSFFPALGGKNQHQILAIINDNTVDALGSDDLLVELTFRVKSTYVRLDPIESVAVGEPLYISGTTNREPETLITICTLAGPVDLPAEIVEVEWPTPDEGVFIATIDTTGAVPGTYTFEADDGDGHVDEWVVEIIIVTVTAIPTPAPTAIPTPTTPPQESIDEILKKLPPGRVLFNPPKEMKVDKTELVEVRITQNLTEEFQTEELTKGLEGRGEPQTQEIKSWACMWVQLTGINFDIKPQNGEKLIIESNKYTEWRFHVTPSKSGIQTLRLTYYVIIHHQGADRQQKGDEVGDWKVNVKVNPVGFLMCNWQFIVGTLIAIVALIISIIGIRKKRREKR